MDGDIGYRGVLWAPYRQTQTISLITYFGQINEVKKLKKLIESLYNNNAVIHDIK